MTNLGVGTSASQIARDSKISVYKNEEEREGAMAEYTTRQASY